MIRLICSVSLRSSSAIIASIELTTSVLTSLVCDSACCASVSTAFSTADFASLLFGLNSFFSSDAKSPPWYSTPVSAEPSAPWVGSAMVCVLRAGCEATRCRLCSAFGLLRRGQRVEQRRIGEHLGEQFLRAGLAVHVGD